MLTQEKHSSPDFSLKPISQEDSNKVSYALDDFSQSAINRGQQKINGALHKVDKKIAVALDALKDAITASSPDINLSAVENAISEVKEAAKTVPGYYPPGCYGVAGGPPPEEPPT